MIRNLLVSLAALVVLVAPTQAEENQNQHKHHHAIDLKKEAPIGNITNVTSLHGSIYMAGQPDEATLKDLKDLGFEVVINIRGKDELTFDEKALVEEQGLTYYNLPLLHDGKIQDSAVEEIHQAVKSNRGRKILFHCSSGNRIAGWFGAHLVRDMGFETERAVNLAKQAGMTKAGMEKILRAYLDTLAQ